MFFEGSGVIANLSFGLPVRSSVGPGFAGLRSAFCRSFIGDPPQFLHRLRRPQLCFQVSFVLFFGPPFFLTFGLKITPN